MPYNKWGKYGNPLVINIVFQCFSSLIKRGTTLRSKLHLTTLADNTGKLGSVVWSSCYILNLA